MFLTMQDISKRYGISLQALSEIANAYLFQGRIEEAKRLFQTGETWLSSAEIRLEDKTAFLHTYGQFLIYDYFFSNQGGDLMDAIVQQGREAAEALKDDAGIATALYLSGLALYYHNLAGRGDNYSEARRYFERAAALREGREDGYGLADALFYSGLTYERHEQESEAENYYQRVLSLGEQYGNALAASEALRHLAGIHMWPVTDPRVRQPELALHYALRSLDLRKQAGFRPYWPSAQLLISDIFLELGELEQALEYCQQAEQLSREMKRQNSLVHALLTRGTIAYRQGKIGTACTHFIEADVLARQLQIPYYIAEVSAKLELLACERDG